MGTFVDLFLNVCHLLLIELGYFLLIFEVSLQLSKFKLHTIQFLPEMLVFTLKVVDFIMGKSLVLNLQIHRHRLLD